MESALMIVPPRVSASASDSADLPLVVGPAISTALMLVATLISNPESPAIDDAVIDIARALLPQAGKPDWLAQGVAADVPFADDGADPRGLAENIRAALPGR